MHSIPITIPGAPHNFILMVKALYSYGKSHKHKKYLSTANTNLTGFMARILQFALPEGAESFTNIKSPTLGTRSLVPPPLLGASKARATKLWEMAAIRDFRLSTKQNIIIRSSHCQLFQIGTKTTNVGIEGSCQNLDQDLTRHRHKQSTGKGNQ